ncbi:MAG: hypothetical protein CM1200mP36_09790 [Gammaproteobacteria bacterium]|nr:MAG: hypothetical protein CM1200mP36_09790 [Gammaproteobacteria bacterium]
MSPTPTAQETDVPPLPHPIFMRDPPHLGELRNSWATVKYGNDLSFLSGPQPDHDSRTPSPHPRGAHDPYPARLDKG